MIRNIFYYKVKTLIPDITELPINGLINELMNSCNCLEEKKNLFQAKTDTCGRGIKHRLRLSVYFRKGGTHTKRSFRATKLHVLENDYHSGIS